MKIPVHILKERTDLGFQLKRFIKGIYSHDDQPDEGAHRDDHYIFFILEKGSGMINIDFNEVILAEGCLFYVLPTQVHQRIQTPGANGWFVAVDTSIVPAECRNIFEGRLSIQEPHTLQAFELQQFHALLMLIFELYERPSGGNFDVMILHQMLKAFLGMTAGHYDCTGGLDVKVSRMVQITAEFRHLLTTELKTLKSPSEFAVRMNISEPYLSETLKKATGFPASYWIHQEIVMEAKRLLYYSPLQVKQIAHELGYTDHAYFSRIFKKITGFTANEFRGIYRK